MFIIRNKVNAELYWSNEWGWGDSDACDLFEDCNYNLPVDGEWEEV
jgi:hypothetical protein